MIVLKNDFLTVSVKPFGAELSGIVANDTGREYLWQGDPAVWNGQAPILFPITGRLSQDRFTYGGETYFLPKHGFARRNAFSVVSSEPTAARLLLQSSEETHRVYPFDFSLSVDFSLSDKTLTVTHTVLNTDAREIFFSIGAHPAFSLHVGDSVRFAEREDFTTCLFDEYGLTVGEETIARDTQSLPITEHLFDHDALFFKNLKSTAATIVEADGNELLQMTYDKVPFLGLWAKPGAPFVCIEPWHGIPDTPDVSGKIEEKPFICRLAPKDSFRFSYSVRIL